MRTITILAMLVILAGVTISIKGFSVTSSVVAQTTSDNATMSGNMTGGNATGGNTTGSISFTDIISGGGGDDGEYDSDDP